jgi:predicted dinucleotide-binding enzyme
MQVGILGAGAVGTAFASRLVAGGHQVVLSNSRGPASLAENVRALGPGASAGTLADAARAQLVVLAVPGDRVGEVLAGLPDWGGRVLVDATNDFTAPPPAPGRPTTSEVVGGLAPGARVIKALNHLFASNLGADPRRAEGNRVLFLSGDDEAAKKEFGELLSGLGYAPIDLGGLADGGRLHQFPGGPLTGMDLVRLPD